MGRRLYRSRTDRVIFGVAGGLGRHFDIDPVIFRVAFVAAIFVSGVGLLAYLILAIATPVEEFSPSGAPGGSSGQPADAATTAGGPGGSTPDYMARRAHGHSAVGLVLIGVGVFFLALHLGWLAWWGWSWTRLWPLVLIGLGLLIILSRARRS